MREYGCQSMVAPLKRVLVRRPDECFGDADPEVWNYSGRPDLAKAQREHDAFVHLLSEFGIEIISHDYGTCRSADSIFVHDPALITDEGAILLRMGKALRRGEEDALEAALIANGTPIWARLEPPACAEAGDLMWLHPRALAVGVGFRTNLDGVRQLERLLKRIDVEVIPVALPVAGGPDACLHLMSLINMIDDRLAVAYVPQLPTPLWQRLVESGVQLIESPESEYRNAMATNVLAVAPRACIMIDGSPITQRRLEDVGCVVRTFVAGEICLKAEGGPTCLTRPLLREC